MGPLNGIRIVELAGIGPGPMACMLMADLGATVVRIARTEPVELGVGRPARFDLLMRNRRLAALDLKQPAAVARLLQLVEHADVLVEGFRPGVAERLGLGPETCLARNARLVYGRITGWGQTGPLAQAAGHDLNYVALTGIIDAIGRAGQPPAVPLVLTGDMGGGALYLVMGVLAALLERNRSGQGQVVDAAIVDGAASLATVFYGMHAAGQWNAARGSNVLDSGAPFYDVYECRDGLWISIGPVEARFYALLLGQLGLDAKLLDRRLDRAGWPQAKALIAQRIRQLTRQQWCERLEGSDVCFAPVLSFGEAPQHPHLQARGSFVTVDGIAQPAPAPRFSRSVPDAPTPPREAPDTDIDALIAEWRREADAGALAADSSRLAGDARR